MSIFILGGLLAVSILFNIIYCIKILMKDEYIRRADNMVKMMDERIEELCRDHTEGKRVLSINGYDFFDSKIIDGEYVIDLIKDGKKISFIGDCSVWRYVENSRRCSTRIDCMLVDFWHFVKDNNLAKFDKS